MGEQVTDPREAAARLRELFDGARSAVFFGGAGVSTASGIPDFRSEDGLYRQRFAYPPEEMLSAGFLREHPEEFFDFYRERMICPDARPNRAHATTESVAAIASRIGKPPAVALDTRRLRTTWIVGHLHNLVPEPVICQAAGLADLQHFAKWHETAGVPAERARTLLRRSPYPELHVAN